MFLVGSAMAGSGIIVPVLPIYGQTFSSSATLVGMLITVFGVARLTANFPSGLAYGRFGARNLMIAGNMLLFIGAVGAALASGMVFLLACRVMQGVGSGVFLTTAGVVIANHSKPGTRGRLLAMYQTAIFVGAAIGPVVGGYIAAAFGLTGPFWAYAIISACAIAASALFRQPPDSHSDNAAKATLASGLGVLIADVRFAANLAMAFASGFSRTAALWQSIPLLAASRHGMGYDLIGLAVTVTALANVAVLPLAGRLTDRYGSRMLPPFSAVLFAAALLLIAFSHGQFGFWSGVALAGVAGGLNGPSLAAALVEMSPGRLIGPAMGAQRTASDLGFVTGPVAVGLIADLTRFGQVGGLVVTAGLLVLAGLIWIAATRRIKSPAA